MEALTAAFSAKVQELKTITSLRADDEAMELMSGYLARMDEDLSSLEQKLEALRGFNAFERQAMPKVELLVQALGRQGAQLGYLKGEAGLLPHNAAAAAREAQATPAGQPGRRALSGVENRPQGGQSQQQPQAGREGKKRAGAPRKYVSQAAFATLSSYMVQRLSVAKVNAAVNEAAELAEANISFLAAARGNARLAPTEKKRAHSLQAIVAGQEGMKGRFWFPEADMRGARLLKHDKTGKALITILRHLGNLQEVRSSSEGESQTVYVLK